MPGPAVALVGVGRWGRNYLRTIEEVGGLSLAAVCDPDLTNPVPDGVPSFSSLPAMLATRSLDAAIIATPTSTHTSLACRCLEAGLDVLVEKPLALAAGEASELLELADRRQLVLATGFQSLYLPGFERCRALLDGDGLGPVTSVESVRTSAGSPDPDADVLWDLASHDLATAISLFGVPLAMECRRGKRRAEFAIDFKNGVALRGTVAWSAGPAQRSFRVCRSRDRAEILDEPVPEPAERPLARLLSDFARACRDRDEPLASGQLGLEVVRCLERLSVATSTHQENERTGVAVCLQ